MKALELLRRAKKYNANITDKELYEAIAELEAFQSRTCKTCKNFYRHDNSLSHGCLKGYSTHIMYGIPCVYVDYGCIRYEPKEQ